MSLARNSHIEHSLVVNLPKQKKFRLRLPTPMPTLVPTAAPGRYLDRLRWLFTGR
jgi:hypothetical protein